MAFKYACIIVLLLSLEIILAQARSAAGKGTIKHRDPRPAEGPYIPPRPPPSPAPTTAPTTPAPGQAAGQVDSAGRCSSLIIANPANQQNISNVTIPSPKWIQTPSIVKIGDNYQALGRVIHLNYLRERLLKQKKFNFAAIRETMNLVPKLEILADTLYVKDTVDLTGIQSIKIYAREIVGESGSKIVVSSPNWDQKYSTPTPQTGISGDDGNDGVNGPQVDIFCDTINGNLDVASNAGDGHEGQDGGNGARAPSSSHTQPSKGSGVCSGQTDYCTCDDIKGLKGIKGQIGGNGGNAGTPGNGGNAGNVNIRYRELNGQVKLKSCRGNGASPATNGVGGQGGAGGNGGKGRNCFPQYIIVWGTRYTDSHGNRKKPGHPGNVEHKREKRRQKVRNWKGECPQRPGEYFSCKDRGESESMRGDKGDDGDTGAPGSTPSTSGNAGSVTGSSVQSGTLDSASKQSFPTSLLILIRRQAEDLLLSSSDDQKGREALEFVLNVANENSGDQKVERIKKYVKRKLAFLGKSGYDIFGNNKQFAPRIKWEALEGTVEDVKDAAEKYENAFNEIIKAEVDAENFQEIGAKISEVSARQVNAEKERLKQAKYIAETEKRLYIKGIKFEEQKMTIILENVIKTLGTAYESGKFNVRDFIAVLQGLVGFGKAIKGGKPGDFIDAALGIAESLRGKSCLKSLSQYTDSVRKWLTFGEIYQPYEDSSQLDFDQLDVSSIPDIMKANLEMNKEQFTKELVCLLEAALPPAKAEFEAEVESFFIAGASRIDLIGKCLDLDNDIGGYLFDIPLLEETEKAIAAVGKDIATPLSTALQQNFMDYLLGTYRTLERSFMRNLYELHKAFVFRTLWEGNNPLISFQRVASESARGTGRLNGAVELTTVLQKMRRDQDKAVKCFTNNIYTTGMKKWSFDSTKDKKMFEQLAQGYARFSLKVDQSCDTCYNLRLLKIYIELFGNGSQPADVPATVLLQVRHLSVSYFRAGDKTIKQYRQPLGSYRNIKFDRFTITDDAECQNRKTKGKCSLFSWACLAEEDSRWQPMCNNQLNRGGCTNQDRLMGMEECKSPFGIYELKIPVDQTLQCNDDRITNTNCKELDLTQFTNMNVWTHFYYWSDQYPSGPDDPICRVPSDKGSQTTSYATLEDAEGCKFVRHSC